MFTVYGQHNCIWCERALTLLRELDHEYDFKYIDKSTKYLEQFKRDWPGRKTVPAISFNNERIGGYEDLRAWVSKHSTNE